MRTRTKAGNLRQRAPGAGRPAKPESERLELVPIRFPRPMLDEVDAIRAARLDQPDRSAMIRALVAEALEARRAKGKGGR